MRLQAEHGRRVPARYLCAVACAFLASAVSSTPAPAAPSLMAGQLHAQPAPSRPAGSLSLSLRPFRMPLRVPDAKAYAAAKAAAQRGYQTWVARHPQAGKTLQAPSSTTSPQTATPSSQRPRVVLFEELNEAGMLGGGLNTGATPPDTTGAIGPNDYVEMVNSKLTVYDRSTLSSLASMGEEEFIKVPSTNPSSCDGQIRWDQQAERWEYAALDCAANGSEGFAFGWSKTAEPGNLSSSYWCKFQVSTGKQLFDYPKLGASDEYLLIGFNAFEEGPKEPAETYIGSGVVTISKPPKGQSSCPPHPETEIELHVKPVGEAFTPVPANLYGASATGYVVAAEYPPSETSPAKDLDVFTVTKNGEGKPELQESKKVAVSSYYFPASVPQPGTTDTIDSSDTRLTQAVAAEDPGSHQIEVWTQHTVAATALGTPSVVRWYELLPGSSTPAQAGTIEGPTGDFAFDGAISPTARGNGAAIDYNVGGSALAAELQAQSRTPLTPSGKMEGEVKLAESEASDKDFSCPSVTKETAPCRWGDYAGASPDPLHPAVVWGTGQVNGPEKTKNGAQWKTQNFALTLRSQKPTAAFSVTTPSPLGGSPVSFDASSSSDPAEAIVAYEWSFGDGSTGTGEKPQHTFSRPGKYDVKLTVMDNAGLTASVEHEVTVADAPPVASFAVPSATANVPAAFDGTSSHDPDGTIASYEWEFGDGTPVQTGATPSHTFASVGTYTVKLTVTDDGGLTNVVEHEVTVTDSPPVASFTAPSSVAPGTLATFDASAAHDPDGTIASYVWSFGDGSPNATGVTASHTYATSGNYTVTLTVTDDKGLTGTAKKTVVVDTPPTASFVVTTSSAIATVTVSFDASASSDSDGTIASYEWSFGDESTGTGEKAEHTYTAPGKYKVMLTVKDNAGLTSSVEHEVTVADAPPVASFTASSSVAAGTPAAFDASASHDPDGTVASYEWSFGDGSPNATGVTASHTYATPGSYTVTLTVTDDKGLPASAGRTITVASPPPSSSSPPSSTPQSSLIQGPLAQNPLEPFAVLSIKPNKKTGGVAITVHAPSTGALQIADANATKKPRRGHKRPAALIKAVRVSIGQAGTMTVQVVPSVAAKRLLGHKGAVTVKALIVYTPTGGKAVKLTKTVVLKKTAKKHHK